MFTRRETRRETKREKKTPRQKMERFKKPAAKFQFSKENKIDYKNLSLLQKFISDRSKIYARRTSGVTAKEQRLLVSAIKKARFLALLSTGGIKK